MAENQEMNRGRQARREGAERERSEFVDKLVTVNRVAKTVKGGRKMRMAAVVVVGDEAGRVGWNKGKSREVPEAVRKATESAKRGLVRVPLRQGRTLHHEVTGRFGATKVILKPAVPGTGIIAGGPMRAIFEAMGIKDVVAKALGSTNPYNLIQATFDAFSRIETPRGIAAKRGLKLTDLTLHREEASKGEVDQKELMEKAAEAQQQKNRAVKDSKKPVRNGRPQKEGAEKAAKPRSERKDSPKVVTVSKSDSMKQAAAKAEATEVAAEEAK